MSVRDVVQAAAGALGGAATYVEDVFSTYLYTGTGSTQTITNGIDLDGEGGLVWCKSRNDTYQHVLVDTVRGAGYYLFSNTTDAQAYDSARITGFNSDGFDLGADSRTNSGSMSSWTWRKSPQFFDIVTYTGTGSATTIPHNLGSVPGCIIVKSTTYALGWPVYHRSLGQYTNTLYLNDTSAAGASKWNEQLPTDSSFPISANDYVNKAGETYVAYLFAHEAGGFGADGTEDVISCGSYTGNSSSLPNTISLGWEPQWVMVKRTDSSGYDWAIWDVMRGMTLSSNAEALEPNTSDAESTTANIIVYPTADGFEFNDASGFANINGGTYVYIAIRRPMKTPTAGTEVFYTATRAGTSSNAEISADIVVDTLFTFGRDSSTSFGCGVNTRLTSPNYLRTYGTQTENNIIDGVLFGTKQTGFKVGADGGSGGLFNNSSYNYIDWMFKRAPGWFEVVAYTGTGTTMTVDHNLGVAPELMIVKNRNSAESWVVYHADLGATRYGFLNGTGGFSTGIFAWNDTEPTATEFTVYGQARVNESGSGHIAYLFATLAGVSKVGSYTGTAANLDVDCGFSAGARFVLIKRTDSTGDWYVWDSARGITAGNDPYLLLNSTATEVTSTDYIDPLASGFTVTSSAPAALNASGGNYIFLAIA